MAPETTETSDSLVSGLKRLYGHVSAERRRQLYLVFALMLLGALAELVTLGAIIPFLALLANPGKAASYPALQTLFSALGWRDAQRIIVPATLLFAGLALTAGATHRISVDTMTLDDALSEFGSIKLIKMDLEGVEGQAIRGAQKVMARTEHVICEDWGGEYSTESAWLAAGFRVRYLDGRNLLASRT